jgi:hypothetical protein
MSQTIRGRETALTVGAAAVVVALAATLGARLHGVASAAAAPVPAPAIVPAPAAIPAGVLEFPCWSCPEARRWPIAFRTNLEALAPLGNGAANAALWLKELSRHGGRRVAEAEAAMARATDNPELGGKVLPAGDPLLLEAEPWADQATMRFYPEIYPMEGFATKIPNYVLGLTLARSWVARGRASAGQDAAMADFRRAIRLGRLLRQEDVTVLGDLVGLACIRYGLEAIYETAARAGSDRLALLASLALSEVAPQRLLTAASVTDTDVSPFSRTDPTGMPWLELPAARLDALLAKAHGAPDRRVRCEALIELGVVGQIGPPEQRPRAKETLTAVAASPDPVLAALARYELAWAPTSDELKRLFTAGPALPPTRKP